MEDLCQYPIQFRDVLAAQRAISRELLRTAIPEWLHLDLTMGQLKTLAVLSADQAMNVSTLAETLLVSKPTASILVDQLVQRDFARRTEDAEDRRRTLVELTTAGADLMAQIRQSGPSARFVQLLEAMDPDDLAALTRGLRALAAIAGRETTSSPSPTT